MLKGDENICRVADFAFYALKIGHHLIIIQVIIILALLNRERQGNSIVKPEYEHTGVYLVTL